MNTRTQLSPLILEQAAGWFGRFRTSEIPLAERKEFLRWLLQSPQHVQAYLEELLRHPDDLPLVICKRLTGVMDEPCSDTLTTTDDDTRH